MVISEEMLAEALSADRVVRVLHSASPPLDYEGAVREFERRRADIDFELSSEQAAFEEALRESENLQRTVRQTARQGGHRWRTLFVAAVAVALAALRFAPPLFGSRALVPVFEAWDSPFQAGVLAAVIWGTVYAAIFVFVWELWAWFVRRPALERELSGKLGLAAAESRLAAAAESRARQLEELVLLHMTEAVNSASQPRFASEIIVDPAPAPGSDVRHLTIGVGLSEVFAAGNEMPTDARRTILKRLETLPGASIGISGPRGVGKSTLLASICGANFKLAGRTAMTVATAAPVEYDAREFLLHLFSSLCRRVLRTEGVGHDELEMLEEEEIARWRRRSWRVALLPASRLMLLLSGPLLLLALAITFLAQTAPTAPVGVTAQPTRAVVTYALGLQPGPFSMLGAMLLVLGGIIQIFLTRPALMRLIVPVGDDARVPWRPDRVTRALEELRNIRFQRSFTSGWSGAIKAPAGLDLGTTSSLTLQQQTESLPELVLRFRDFVQYVAQEYGQVIFGIDELDKLKSAADAEAFLNGIKSVFGVHRCFYLISVSEHALASFERRGIGFRDAFDSALDDVLHVGFLTLDASRALLDRRILRLPDPFVQLCHMFSGGLPRDLIRHARHLLDIAAEQPGQKLGLLNAADLMVMRDLEARIRATSIAIRTAKEVPSTSQVLVRIAGLPAGAPPDELESALVQLREWLTSEVLLQSGEDRQLQRLALELLAYGQMMVALRRVADLLATKKGWEQATHLNLAEQVAAVRQGLEVSDSLAAARLVDLQPHIDHALAPPRAPARRRRNGVSRAASTPPPANES